MNLVGQDTAKITCVSRDWIPAADAKNHSTVPDLFSGTVRYAIGTMSKLPREMISAQESEQHCLIPAELLPGSLRSRGPLDEKCDRGTGDDRESPKCLPRAAIDGRQSSNLVISHSSACWSTISSSPTKDGTSILDHWRDAVGNSLCGWCSTTLAGNPAKTPQPTPINRLWRDEEFPLLSHICDACLVSILHILRHPTHAICLGCGGWRHLLVRRRQRPDDDADCSAVELLLGPCNIANPSDTLKRSANSVKITEVTSTTPKTPAPKVAPQEPIPLSTPRKKRRERDSDDLLNTAPRSKRQKVASSSKASNSLPPQRRKTKKVKEVPASPISPLSPPLLPSSPSPRSRSHLEHPRVETQPIPDGDPRREEYIEKARAMPAVQHDYWAGYKLERIAMTGKHAPEIQQLIMRHHQNRSGSAPRKRARPSATRDRSGPTRMVEEGSDPGPASDSLIYSDPIDGAELVVSSWASEYPQTAPIPGKEGTCWSMQQPMSNGSSSSYSSSGILFFVEDGQTSGQHDEVELFGDEDTDLNQRSLVETIEQTFVCWGSTC